MDWSFLNTYPIYLVSSHGEYQLGDRDDEQMPASFIVPPKTYIFEMSTVGELCLTQADRATWELCQGMNRQAFIEYFLRTQGSSEFKKSIFRNLTFYKPGDTIYTRYLKMGERTRGSRAGPADYESFGFYKFNVNDPRYTYGDGNGTLIMFANLMNTLQKNPNNFTSTEIVINRVRDEDRYPGFEFAGGIFFFTSCGAHGCDDNMTPLCMGKMNSIARLQNTQRLFLQTFGITSGGHGAGEGADVPIPKRYHNRVEQNNDHMQEWLEENNSGNPRHRRYAERVARRTTKKSAANRGKLIDGVTTCQWFMGKLRCGFLGGKRSRKMRRRKHFTRKRAA